jgi:hypothetical protein
VAREPLSHKSKIALSASLIEAIRERSEALGVSGAQFIRTAIYKHLERTKPKAPGAYRLTDKDVAKLDAQLRTLGTGLAEAFREDNAADLARALGRKPEDAE